MASERRPTHWLRLAVADLVGMVGDELEVQGRALQRRASLTYRRLYPDERPITERMAEAAKKIEQDFIKNAPRPQDNPLLAPLREACICGHRRSQHFTGLGCQSPPGCSCTSFYDRAWAEPRTESGEQSRRAHYPIDRCTCGHHRVQHGRDGCTVDGCACPGTHCDGCRANRDRGVHL